MGHSVSVATIRPWLVAKSSREEVCKQVSVSVSQRLHLWMWKLGFHIIFMYRETLYFSTFSLNFFQQLSPCGSNKRRFGQQPIICRPPPQRKWLKDGHCWCHGNPCRMQRSRKGSEGTGRQSGRATRCSSDSRASNISIPSTPPQTYKIHTCKSTRPLCSSKA